MSYFASRNVPGQRKWFNLARIDNVQPTDLPVSDRITITMDDDEVEEEEREEVSNHDGEESGRVCAEVDMACRSFDPLGVTGVPRVQKSALTVPVPFSVCNWKPSFCVKIEDFSFSMSVGDFLPLNHHTR